MISVTVQGLVKRFGEMVALDHLDLRIEPGEIFFLLGPSGCGKTTLLRSIAGFYIPDEGSLHFDKDDVTRVPPHLRNTGMMFQSYALWPHMKVFENVAFGLQERRVAKPEIQQRVTEALASVKMGQYAERKIAQLSGGQQQRVALARALVIRPRCLLLDEPLSNLDAKLRLEMRGEIRRICKEFGLTAIYVTHDQKEALSIGDRIALLDKGRIQQVGPPRELYRAPTSRLVADFIGDTNFIEGEVVRGDSRSAWVSTKLGPFEGVVTRAGWSPSPGEKVTLSVRPECWRFQTAAAGQNCATGHISDATYLGEIAQYHFHASGEEIGIYELNPQFIEFGTEKTLHAVVEKQDVVVLKE